MIDPPLAAAFLARLDADRARELSSVDDLEARLAAMVERARQAWPSVHVDAHAFVEHVAARTGEQSLDDLHTDDLYLACACAAGDANAITLLDAAGIASLDGALVAAGATVSTVADVKQILRERLFVAVDGRRGIEQFAGHGDVRGWLRVAAVREVIRARGRTQREVQLEDDAILDRLVARDDPELSRMRAQCATELRAIFGKAMASLSVRERNLLRLHFIDGMSIDDIGSLHDVHRSTAARWLVKAERLLQRSVRRDLKDCLGVDTEELAGIWNAIESQLELSIDGLLRTR